MNTLLTARIVELWHVSRTAIGSPTHYDRMLYVRSVLQKEHPELSPKSLWLEIEKTVS